MSHSVRIAVVLGIALISGLLGWPVLGALDRSDTPDGAVESDALEPERLAWTIESIPRVSIGGSPATVDGEIHEVAAGAVLSDGRIAIADGGSRSVQVFDQSGRAVAAFGREGSGPGEFRAPILLNVVGADSIYVFDEQLQRLTVFHPALGLRRTANLRTESPLRLIGKAGSQTTYAKSPDRVMPPVGPGGVIRDTVRYYALGESLAVTLEMTSLPGLRSAAVAGPNGERGFRGAPYSPRPRQGVLGSCLVITDSETPALSIYDESGEKVREIAIDLPAVPVTEAHREAFYDWMLSSGNVPAAQRPLLRGILETLPMPERLPLYNDLIVDSENHLWLQRYQPPSGAGTEWLIVGPDGSSRGTVSTPEPLQILDIGDDYVLGLSRDSLGLETVALFGFIREDIDPVPSLLPACTT